MRSIFSLTVANLADIIKCLLELRYAVDITLPCAV